MPEIRYFMLVLFIVVLVPAILKRRVKDAAISFVIGLIFGSAIDFVGSYLLRLWDYAGPTWVYVLITIPCWGVFSMAINLLWNWIENPRVALPVITLGLFSYLELPNMITGSWIYSMPLWFVAIGWIPLVLSFRVIYALSVRFFRLF